MTRCARSGEHVAQRGFDRLVGFGDEGGVGLGVDHQIGGAELAERDLVGDVRQFEGQLEVGMQGRRAS